MWIGIGGAVLTALIEKVPGPGKGFSGPGDREAPGGIKDRFQVYDIVFDDDGNLIEDVAELAILVQAKELHAQGASLRRVARELPLNPRTGKMFAASQIVRML